MPRSEVEAVPVTVSDPDSEGDADEERVGDCVAVVDTELVEPTVPDSVLELVKLERGVKEALPESEMVCVDEIVPGLLAVSDTEGVDESVPDSEYELDAERVCSALPETEMLPVALCEADTVAVMVTESE